MGEEGVLQIKHVGDGAQVAAGGGGGVEEGGGVGVIEQVGEAVAIEGGFPGEEAQEPAAGGGPGVGGAGAAWGRAGAAGSGRNEGAGGEAVHQESKSGAAALGAGVEDGQRRAEDGVEAEAEAPEMGDLEEEAVDGGAAGGGVGAQVGAGRAGRGWLGRAGWA